MLNILIISLVSSQENDVITCTILDDGPMKVWCTHENGTIVDQCMNCFSPSPLDCIDYNCLNETGWSCSAPEVERIVICDDENVQIFDYQDDSIDDSTDNEDDVDDDEEEDIEVKCPVIKIRNDYIDIIFQGLKAIVEIEKNPWFERFEIDQTTFVKINDRARLTSGTINVNVICGKNAQSYSFPILGSVICEISDCLFCKQTYDYFRCTTTQHKMMMITLILLMILLIVALIVSIFCCAIRVKRSCSAPVVLLIMMIAVAQPCDDVKTFKFDSDSVVNGVLVKTTDVVINMNRIGSTVCLNLDDGNQTVGNIELKLRNHRILFDGDLMYKTSSWTNGVAVRKRCPSTQGCPGGRKCEFSGACASVDGQCQLEGEAINLPGETRCQSSCGCAGCGCGVCSDGCLFSRFAIKNNEDDYLVHNIFQSKNAVDFELKFVLGNEEFSRRITQNLGDTFTHQNFSMSLVGSDIDGSQFFGQDCWVSSSTSDWLLPCSPLNAPIASGIGDLQYSGSTVNYQWSAVQHNPVDKDKVQFVIPAQGVRLLTSSRQLPLNRGSCLISYNSSRGIQCNWQGAVQESLHISIPAGFSLIREINSCSVKGSLVSQEGCSRCVEGFSLSFKIESECQTNVQFRSDSWTIFNQFHSVIPGSQEVVVRVYTNQVTNNGRIELISDTVQYFDLSFHAPELNRTIENNSTRLIGTSPDGKLIIDSGFLSGLFGNIPTWSKILIMIAIAGGIILGAFLVVKYGPSWIQSCRKRRAYKKINEESVELMEKRQENKEDVEVDFEKL